MKKLIIAAAIVLTSGVTALSVTKKASHSAGALTEHVNQADFTAKTFAGAKNDVAVIQ